MNNNSKHMVNNQLATLYHLQIIVLAFKIN